MNKTDADCITSGWKRRLGFDWWREHYLLAHPEAREISRVDLFWFWQRWVFELQAIRSKP